MVRGERVYVYVGGMKKVTVERELEMEMIEGLGGWQEEMGAL